MFGAAISKALLIAIITVSIWQTGGIAAETSIIDAINKGVITLDTKVAIPPTRTEAPTAPGPTAVPTDLLYAITASEERNITDKAYPLMSAKWPFNVVFVCWENPSNADIRERGIVQRAVAESWEANSSLRFKGWQECVPATTGVRILIEDSGPHVKMMGKYVDGIRNGMVLNFTFNQWSPSCQTMRDSCIYSIAVHEFGHAIGFAHEQNRPDTPGECSMKAQGPNGDDLLLTSWDPHSVMNYCNSVYNNGGQLSALDIKAVAYIYGAR
jgi:hypothetical protein